MITLRARERLQLCRWRRYILESEYGYVVGENLYLGVVHPDVPAPRLIRVPFMQEEMLLIAEDQVRLGNAVSFAVPGPHAQFRLPNCAT